MRACFALFCLLFTACSPRIQLETPPEGITINMNVVVDHHIKVEMDEKSRTMINIEEQNKTNSEF